MYKDNQKSIRSSFGPVVRACVAAVATFIPVGAAAQAPSPAPVAGWQNGFFIQSANGDNRLTLGTVVQVDGRFTTDDPPATIDTFNIRKARIVLGGRVAKYFDFRLVPDFGNGQTNLLDAYVDVRFSQAFRIRTGKDKTPVGYEILIGDAALIFPERALPSSLLPNRDVGIQAQGDLLDGRLTYGGGVLNGVVDGTSSTVDVDTNSGKDVAGRVTLLPFKSVHTLGGALSGLGFHAGGSRGNQIGALPAFRTSVGQTYFSYAPAGNGLPAAVASGARTRLTPAVFYFHKSFGAFAEYVRATQAVARGGSAMDVTNHGWEVTTSYLLTGETATSGIPTPKTAFDPPAGKWGGLQIVARYASLTIDDAIFDAGFAAANASHQARQITIGANWYPAAFVKYYLNYERTTFEPHGAGDRAAEHTIFLRVQLAF